MQISNLTKKCAELIISLQEAQEQDILNCSSEDQYAIADNIKYKMDDVSDSCEKLLIYIRTLSYINSQKEPK